MTKRINLPVDEIISIYKSGKSIHEIADVFSVSAKTIQKRLNERNIEMRGIRKELPINEIISLYKSGTSIKSLSDKFNVSRATITKRLKEQRIKIRGQREAGLIYWENLPQEDYGIHLDAPHEAAKGRTASFEEKAKRAKTREQNFPDTANVSEYEMTINDALLENGFDTTPQKAVGPYNCDIAVNNIDIEIFGGGWHWYGKHLAIIEKRFRYLLNNGWFIYVIPINKRRWFITDDVIEHLISYINRIGIDKPSVCEYRVVWGAGEFVTAGSVNDENISIKPPFRS